MTTMISARCLFLISILYISFIQCNAKPSIISFADGESDVSRFEDDNEDDDPDDFLAYGNLIGDIIKWTRLFEQGAYLALSEDIMQEVIRYPGSKSLVIEFFKQLLEKIRSLFHEEEPPKGTISEFLKSMNFYAQRL